MRRSVDGPLRERWRVAAAARRKGGAWRQPMRLPARANQRPSTQIEIGQDVFIGRHAWVNLTSRQASLEIGDKVAIGNSFTVGCGQRVQIGAGVMMSDRVTILDQLHDFRRWIAEAMNDGRDPTCTWDLTEPSPVVVGAGTWLGIGVVVLPGVTIGRGCAVGANAVVTRDLPEFSVAVGVPARIIGSAIDVPPEEVRQL